MENGVQALLMAAAVLIFIIALTITLTTLSQAKTTADSILFYSDREIYQEKVDQSQLVPYKMFGARPVNIDTVIATIKRFTRENFAVIIKDSSDVVKLDLDYSTQSIEYFKNKISDFIHNNIGSSSTYLEYFVEVNTGGITSTGYDGTSLGENVGKKLYIIYKEI